MRAQQIDLNLVLVFDAMMQSRSVSATAQMLNRSRPAISHALDRMRRAIGDDLFVYDGHQMSPTHRALELATGLQGGLRLIDSALGNSHFTPSTSIRTFQIAAGDYTQTLLLPAPSSRLEAAAPNIDLKFVPVSAPDVTHSLVDGLIDLAIGWFDSLPGDFDRRLLMHEGTVYVVREGHPLTQGRFDKSDLFSYPQIVVEYTGRVDGGRDGFLNDEGIRRRVWMQKTIVEAQEVGDEVARVALRVTNFSSVPAILRQSNKVASLPIRVARSAAAAGGIVILPIPGMLRSVPIEAVCHAKTIRDAGVRWLIDQFAVVAAVL